MTTSLYLTRRLITYVILLGSVAFPLALIRYRYLPFTAALLGQISSWDFGYAIEHYLLLAGIYWNTISRANHLNSNDRWKE